MSDLSNFRSILRFLIFIKINFHPLLGSMAQTRDGAFFQVLRIHTVEEALSCEVFMVA